MDWIIKIVITAAALWVAELMDFPGIVFSGAMVELMCAVAEVVKYRQRPDPGTIPSLPGIAGVTPTCPLLFM